MKFKVGDWVRQISNPSNYYGEITKIVVEDDWPIEIRNHTGNTAVFEEDELEFMKPSSIKSDGGSSSYYDLPKDAKDIDDLIHHKKMPWPIANIFKACYRYGEKEGNSKLYDLNKIVYFASREKGREESRNDGI